MEDHRGGAATLGVQSTLAKLSLCRTAALGGRWYSCDDCGEVTKIYNSCGDRHCPGCSGAKRADFNDRAAKLITPGVEHFQVIFTVPEIISTLALGNRSEITDLLFKSAWRALDKTITAEQGYEPAALMVLHTWNQKLDAHWHVHALVPGTGPSIHGDGLEQARSPHGDDSQKYLVDAINLRRKYRKLFLRGLQSLYRRGKLSFDGNVKHLRSEAEWDALLDRLGQQEWVSHIEPPPSELSEANHVLAYMTRYLTGGPISDHRIVSADDCEVTLLARAGRRTGGDREQVPVTLTTKEFVRRWCLHIQPHQLTKTRCFGGWSNSKLQAYRLRMEAATASSTQCSTQHDGESSWEERELCCESCGGKSLRLSHREPKRRWSELLALDSQCSPWWYQRSLEVEEKRAWDEAMGEGYYDWYVANVLRPAESARDPAPSGTRLAIQLLLPGIEPELANTSGYLDASF